MPVIIKAYDKSKMKPKNTARVEREIRLMRDLGGGDGLVKLYAVFEDSAHRYLVRCILSHCITWSLSAGLLSRLCQVNAWA